MTEHYKVTIPVNGYMIDLNRIIEEMLLELQDIPREFKSIVAEGIIYMALFDEAYKEEYYWSDLTAYLNDSYREFFESSVEFDDEDAPIHMSHVETEERDEECTKWFTTHGKIHFEDVDSDEIKRAQLAAEVTFISDKIPANITFHNREEMHFICKELATMTAEMFAEYDLASNEDYLDLACNLRDTVENVFKCEINDIDAFDIRIPRRVIILKMPRRLKCGLRDISLL